MCYHGIEDYTDPFLEADECMELKSLIEKAGDSRCTVDEYLTGDSDLPVSADMDDDNWDRTFLEELGNKQYEEPSRDSIDKNDIADQEELPKLKGYKEAVVSLEEVSLFLEYNGHGDEVLSSGYTIDRIVNLVNKTDNTTQLFHTLTIFSLI